MAMLAAAANADISNVIYCGAKVDANVTHTLSYLGFAGLKDMNYTDLVEFEQGMKNSPNKHYLIEWKGKHEFPTADVFNDAFIFLNTGTVENYEKKQVTITPDKVAEEQAAKQKYMGQFQSQDISWWKKEIERLNLRKDNNMMDARLLGFLSLACYYLANDALKKNDLTSAGKILTIYKMADPDNKDCDAMFMVYNQRKGGH